MSRSNQPWPRGETGARVAADCARLFAAQTPPPLLTSFSTVALTAAGEAAPALPRAWSVRQWDDGLIAPGAGAGRVRAGSSLQRTERRTRGGSARSRAVAAELDGERPAQAAPLWALGCRHCARIRWPAQRPRHSDSVMSPSGDALTRWLRSPAGRHQCRILHGIFPFPFPDAWYFSGGFPVVSCRCQHVRCCAQNDSP